MLFFNQSFRESFVDKQLYPLIRVSCIQLASSLLSNKLLLLSKTLSFSASKSSAFFCRFIDNICIFTTNTRAVLSFACFSPQLVAHRNTRIHATIERAQRVISLMANYCKFVPIPFERAPDEKNSRRKLKNIA